MFVWFCELAAARRVGWTLDPIGYPDILAYSRLHGLDMRPFEVALIREADVAVLRIAMTPKDQRPPSKEDVRALKAQLLAMAKKGTE